MMTVQALIEKLQTYPLNAEVLLQDADENLFVTSDEGFAIRKDKLMIQMYPPNE